MITATPETDPLGEPHERTGGAERFARRLSFAIRVCRFYPPASPVVERKLDEAHLALQEVLAHGPLRFAVGPDRLCWQRGRANVVLEEAALAAALHQRGIAAVRFDTSVTREALHEFIRRLSSSAPHAAGQADVTPGEAMTLGGIRLERLQVDRLFGEGERRLEQGELWNRLLQEFTRERGLRHQSWTELARDTETLRALLRWTLSPRTQPKALRHHAQPEVFHLLGEQIGAVALEEPPIVAAQLAEAAAGLVEELDPEAWLEILADPLPLGGERDADVTHLIAERLSEEQVQRLIRYALQFRDGATGRLYRFFDRLLQGRERRRLATEILSGVADPDDTSFARAWPSLLDSLLGDPIDPFVEREYATVLHRQPAEPAGPPAWDMEQIGPRLADLGEGATQVSYARVCLALLQREREPDDARALLTAALAALPTLLQEEEFNLLEQLVGRVATIAADGSHPCQAVALQELGTLRRPELVGALVHGLAATAHEERCHVVARIVEHLGAECLPALLETLAAGGKLRLRAQLARLIGSLSEFPTRLFERALAAERPVFVRDVVWVLSALDRPERAPLLRRALRHEDPAVRRTALAGLVRAGGADLEGTILRAMSDPALEVRVQALRGFRSLLGGQERQQRLQRYLSLRNWTGRNNATIVAAIRAAAALGDPLFLPRLRALARRPLLFPRRRRPVRSEARKALARLGRQQQPEGSPASRRRAA